jgi:hypothetical protein
VAGVLEKEYIGAMSYQPPDPRVIAERGTEIYEKYRAKYEKESRGRFAAIDIDSERAYVADYPEEVLAIARSAAPNGSFYLVHIGSRAAFKISRRSHARSRGV